VNADIWGKGLDEDSKRVGTNDLVLNLQFKMWDYFFFILFLKPARQHRSESRRSCVYFVLRLDRFLFSCDQILDSPK
jgi:hypothetical protein